MTMPELNMKIKTCQKNHEMCRNNTQNKATDTQQKRNEANANEGKGDLEVSIPNDSNTGIFLSKLNKDDIKLKEIRKVKFSTDCLSDYDKEDSVSWIHSLNSDPGMDDSRSSDCSISLSGLILEDDDDDDTRNLAQFNHMISRASPDEKKLNVLSHKSTPSFTIGITDEFDKLQDIQKMKSMSFLSTKLERSKGSFESLKSLASGHSSWKPRSQIDLFSDLEGSYVE